MSVRYLWLYLVLIGALGWVPPQAQAPTRQHRLGPRNVRLTSMCKGAQDRHRAEWLNCRVGGYHNIKLVEIKVTENAAGGYGIELRDRSGGEADTALDFMHSNRDLRELVYNGMRHSVATGATMNAIARP
jgi:hypothetical protein